MSEVDLLERARALEAIRVLTRSATHDLDNQMAAIVGFIEIALLRAGDDQALRADLQEIRDAAIRAVERTGHLRLRTPRATSQH